ncbi:MAG: HlyD family efflux transporter periplasmic adaptor subunit [Phycisphaerae bacterium]|nr:HlyD family efflux transporter periplasmic adaptor subunit [Phycisphaerae bacterium]
MRRILIVVVLIFLAIGVWLYWQASLPSPFVVSGFVEADQIRVGSRVGGRVAEVLVEEGDRMAARSPLFRLDPFDLLEQLKAAEANLAARRAEHQKLSDGFRPEEIEQARARRDRAAAVLKKLEAGPRPREIQIARERLNAARADLEYAESEYQRLAGLREQDAVAKSEFDQAVRQRDAARAQVAAAEQELALLEEGFREEEIAEARAQLAEAEQALKLLTEGYRREEIAQGAAQAEAAQAEVAAIRERLGELTVVAPCDCVIEAIDLRPGDLVSPNAPSVSLLDTSRMWVRTYVPEVRLGQVGLGQAVGVRVDSFPEETFAGRVTFVAREGEFTPRNIQTPEERSKQVFRVKVTLDDGYDRLRVGMAADVWFEGPPDE